MKKRPAFLRGAPMLVDWLLVENERVLCLEQRVDEQPARFGPHRLHCCPGRSVGADEGMRVRLGVAFALILGVEEPLPVLQILNPSLAELAIERDGAHAEFLCDLIGGVGAAAH